MKFQVTNPKAWKAVNEKNMPMSHKIKVYEKLGGAYRLGEDGGEQVFNKMTELLKHKIQEGEGEDHEVSMGQNQLDSIIKYATELKQHLGEDEKEIPAWIQDHISKSQNYISQAASNYHEYGQKEPMKEEQPGLWANIRAKQARGEKPAHGNSDAHKDAVKAAKQINKK
jgi:hypothetical protein